MIEALREYTERVRAFNRNDDAAAIPALEQAIATDSTFAMAHRRLAAALGNTDAPLSRVMALSRKAVECRLRLPSKERYQAEAWYYL